MNATATDILLQTREDLALLQEVHNNDLREARREAVCNMLRELTALIASVEGNSAEFKVLAIQEFVGSYSMATQCPVTMTMYVQPSQYEQFVSSNYNLLTLSRSGAFPFNRKVEVRF